MSGPCTGVGEHCCVLQGVTCPFVIENVPGRGHACGLMIALGSWEAVASSSQWHEHVAPLWSDVFGEETVEEGHGCWDWPQYVLEEGRLEPGPWACCFWEGDA